MIKWLSKLGSILLILLMSIGAIFIFCAAVSLPFWILWNLLIPDIFGLPEINWLQATGLWLMLALLNTLGFNYTKTLQTTRETIENNPKWDDIFLSIKKNYTA
jgi:hypothetical protein|tara:strand:+ start:464 stop:772 length:309 start_codon:yes stop_codon:yes gene_type:complete